VTKKWVTSGIKICSKRKNKLYKKWKLTGKEPDSTTYNNYRKIYKKVLAEAEQSYYREKFSLKCNSIKQLWSNLNQIFSLSKTKTCTNISELLVNNVSVIFKTAYITPLLKKPDADPADVKQYRPISNLSVLSKLL